MVNESSRKNFLSENVRSIINAISLLLTYIVIGLLLYFSKNFFGSVTKAIVIGFTAVGIIGIITEGRKLNISYNMKGLDNVLLGSILMVIFYLLKVFIKTDSYNKIAVFVFQIVLFLFLLTAVFVFCKGLLEMIYSMALKSKDKGIGIIVSSILVMIAQITALIILLLQIFNIVF